MKRFLKTYTVKRKTQFTVLQDSDALTFQIVRWTAAQLFRPEVVQTLPYTRGNDRDEYRVRDLAFTIAGRLCDAERLAADVVQAVDGAASC